MYEKDICPGKSFKMNQKCHG